MVKAFVGAVVLFLALITPTQAVTPELRPPAWVGLTSEQRAILAPLAPDWNTLDDTRKRKWLGIAARYPSMSFEEQERMQSRMREWVTLTPEQRDKAREQFMSRQKASPEQREAVKQKWQEYETLPEDEKKKLQAQPAVRQPVAPPRPITGRMPAVTPAVAAPAATRTSGTPNDASNISVVPEASKPSGGAQTPGQQAVPQPRPESRTR